MTSNPCSTLPLPAPPAWALMNPSDPLREVLVLGAPRPALKQLGLLLQREGYVPSVVHTGEQALQRIVQEPIPPVLLVNWATPGEGTQHFLQALQHAGALGWFSLVLIGGGELPRGLYAQARLASDCSTEQLLEVLGTYSA